MGARSRKFIGAAAMLSFVVFYALAAMALSEDHQTEFWSSIATLAVAILAYLVVSRVRAPAPA